MEDIYILSDSELLKRIGRRLKSMRLKQELSQAALAVKADVSLSSLKRLEEGNVKSVDVLIRIMRTLGSLDIFTSLVEEEQPSPAEIFKMMESANKHRRKRAPRRIGNQSQHCEEESEW